MSKIHYLSDYTNKYSCDTCDKKYLTSAKGITLNLTVENNSISRDVTLFNENAEKFLEADIKDSKDVEFSDEELLHTVKGNQYEFVVTSGKMKNEFICQSFTLISTEGNKDERTTQGNKDKITGPNHINATPGAGPQDNVPANFEVEQMPISGKNVRRKLCYTQSHAPGCTTSCAASDGGG